jgi:sulfopyruvate decarboxylase subunit alpha
LSALKKVGVRLAVGVPDTWIGGILDQIERDPDMTLIRATHEEEALAIACGSRLGGTRTALIIQNVGLLTMGSGLVALAMRYQFPILILAAYRGSGRDPVYYHVAKGHVTEPVLRGFGLPYVITNPLQPIGPQIEDAAAWAEEASTPFVLLLSKEDIKW